jgi:SAM-dependent methyltransferase/uncharacterized protein YbaR (Trm112 family)
VDPLFESPLRLASVLREENDLVIEGALRCSNHNCQREFPIIDGIPLILSGLRDYVSSNVVPILARADLHATTESMLGDCMGPNSAWDALRYQLSCYAWDHYGSYDPLEHDSLPRPGTTLALLDRGRSLCGAIPQGVVLDVGCSVGGMTFALAAQSDNLVLGVDVNFGMLRVAQQVLQSRRITYPRRRIGAVYDRREFPVPVENSQNVDFWACDATSLPFGRSTVSFVTALNILDCVSSPIDLLSSLATVLESNGRVLASTPYDWSTGATPFEAWLGGHSQRGEEGGAAEPILRRLLTSAAHPQSIHGLELLAEADDVPWTVRLHERSAMSYLVHLLVARKRPE